MTNCGLLNIACLIFDIFPRDPTLSSPCNRVGGEDASFIFYFSFLRDVALRGARQIYKHLLGENGAEKMKAPGDVSVSLLSHDVSDTHVLLDGLSHVCLCLETIPHWNGPIFMNISLQIYIHLFRQ